MKYENWKSIIIRGKLNVFGNPDYKSLTREDAEQCRKYKPSSFKDVSTDTIMEFYELLNSYSKNELNDMLNLYLELDDLCSKSDNAHNRLLDNLNEIKYKLGKLYPNKNIFFEFNHSGKINWCYTGSADTDNLLKFESLEVLLKMIDGGNLI